jgi:hypothetical protein
MLERIDYKLRGKPVRIIWKQGQPGFDRNAKRVKYSRPSLFAVFLSAVLLIRGPKTAFFRRTNPSISALHWSFYCEFVIRGPIFQERIYRK